MNCWFLSLYIVFLIYFILSVDAVMNNMLIDKILVEFFWILELVKPILQIRRYCFDRFGGKFKRLE